MNIHPLLLTVWGILAACFAALLMYRGQLTRYEDEQLFLSDEASLNAKRQQTEIVRKVNKLEPLVRVFGGAAGLMTACVIGLYAYQAWQNL